MIGEVDLNFFGGFLFLCFPDQKAEDVREKTQNAFVDLKIKKNMKIKTGECFELCLEFL